MYDRRRLLAQASAAVMPVLIAACTAAASPSPPTHPETSAVTASIVPSPGPPLDLSQRFTSTIHGLSVSYPAGWTANAATRPWTTATPSQTEGARDTIEGPAGASGFIGLASQALGDRGGDEWVTEHASASLWGDSCEPVPSVPVTIGGAAGIIVAECPGRPLLALTAVDGRGYWIVLYGYDDLDWFRDILATVELAPERASDAVPAASP